MIKATRFCHKHGVPELIYWTPMKTRLRKKRIIPHGVPHWVEPDMPGEARCLIPMGSMPTTDQLIQLELANFRRALGTLGAALVAYGKMDPMAQIAEFEMARVARQQRAKRPGRK